MRCIPVTALFFCLSCPGWADNQVTKTSGSSDELHEMAIPDLPDGALPDIFKRETPTTNSYDPAEVNLVEVSETFYKLETGATEGELIRRQTNEARPGDLIEVAITAINKSSETVTDVQMVNQVPQGPVALQDGSFKYDKVKSLYRISRSGKTFFPADAELAIEDIKFIQWHILSLAPGESIEFSYQIRISP